jgi:deazaflavin-dependent oxidoreductase (nitroreductase family)
MPSDLALKTMNRVHRAILAVSGGRIGWNAGGMTALQLHTIGRTTGERRSVMLTCPIEVDGNPVVVASRGGDDHHPAWFLNLQAHPEVEVTMRGETRPMLATVVPDDERAALWKQVTAAQKRYAGYQKRTERAIPLVILTPR